MDFSNCVDFPAVHRPFYDNFDPWRKEKLKTSLVHEGIYFLLAGKPVPRCIMEDPDGILYIGKGVILKPNHRIGQLINAINTTDVLHEAGVRANRSAFIEHYKVTEMSIKIRICEESAAVESRLLAEYVSEFGELPPLNHRL